MMENHNKFVGQMVLTLVWKVRRIDRGKRKIRWFPYPKVVWAVKPHVIVDMQEPGWTGHCMEEAIEYTINIPIQVD